MCQNPRDFKHIEKMVREWTKNKRPEDFKYLQERVREAEKARPIPEQIESLRQQTQMVQQWLSDPQVRRAHEETARILAQHGSVLAAMPNEETQKRLLEAARHFDSHEFQAQRDAILQANQIVRQRLGSEGLAAAQRIATRHTVAYRSQEQAAERIKSGEATVLLREATRLAASPEVRETIENADPEAILWLDQEEGSEEFAAEPEAGVERETVGEEYPEFTKEELLEMHTQALMVLWPLEVALVVLALTPATSSVGAPLTLAVGGLTVFVEWSERMISRWED